MSRPDREIGRASFVSGQIVRPPAEHLCGAGFYISSAQQTNVWREMRGPDENRLADTQLRVEEAQAVVDLQRAVVLELQRKGQDAREAKQLLLRCIEFLILHQEELDRIKQGSDVNA